MTKEYPKANFQDFDEYLETDSSSEMAFWGCTAADLSSGDLHPGTLVLHDSPPAAKQRFDLEERTALFGECVIRFCKTAPINVTSSPIIKQLIRSGTSIGANYCEADDAVSKKDFKNKIGICRKEARETKYWLRMIATVDEGMKNEAREIWKEARELHLIFCKIFRNS